MAWKLVLVGIAFLIGACGADRRSTGSSDAPGVFTSPAHACGLRGVPPPPARFIAHENGVPDQYIVVLVSPVPDVPRTAAALAAQYGGEVLAVYEVVLGGFAVRITAAGAEAMSADVSVCWVEQDGYVSAASVPTCSELARQYKEVLESDASLCTVGDDATCAARRPMWGAVMDGDAVLSYGLSECPVTGSGVPVNPARVERLDALLAAYRAAGCDLSAGPGCGAPGWAPSVATCAGSADGLAWCR